MSLAAYLAEPDPKMKPHWLNMYTMDIQGYSRLSAKQIHGLVINVKDPYRGGSNYRSP